MAGHASHPPCRRVVYFPVENHLADLFRGGDAVVLGQRLEESGVGHAERLENIFGNKQIEPLAGDEPHDLAQ